MCHRRNDAFDCPEFSSLLSLRGEGLRTRHARCRNVSPLINSREADVPTGERRKARTFLRSYVRTCTSVKFMHTCASNQPTPAKDKKQGKPAWFRDCLRERERERESVLRLIPATSFPFRRRSGELTYPWQVCVCSREVGQATTLRTERTKRPETGIARAPTRWDEFAKCVAPTYAC